MDVGDYNQLIDSCRNGNIESVRKFLNSSEIISKPTSNLCFSAAIENNQLTILDMLMDAGLDKSTFCVEIINLVCYQNNLDIFIYLLEKYIDVHIDNDYILIYICCNVIGRYKFVLYLLQNCEFSQRSKNDALFSVGMTGDYDMFKLLLDHGADPFFHENIISIILDNLRAEKYSTIKIIKLLISMRAYNKNDINELFIMSLDFISLDLIKLFVDHGADIHTQNEYALCFICEQVEDSYQSMKDRPSILEYLLQNGANINAQDGQPLITAIMNDDYDLVKLLLEYGADIKLVKGMGIARASHYGYETILKLLLEYGDDTSQCDDGIIVNPSMMGKYDIVKILLENMECGNYSINRALQKAAKNGHNDVIELLIEYGADVHSKNEKALKNACYNNHINTIKLLLKYGADVNIDNGAVMNILFIASYLGSNKESIELILESGFDVSTIARLSENLDKEIIKLLQKFGTKIEYMEHVD